MDFLFSLMAPIWFFALMVLLVFTTILSCLPYLIVTCFSVPSWASVMLVYLENQWITVSRYVSAARTKVIIMCTHYVCRIILR